MSVIDFLFGRPLRSSEERSERLGAAAGIPVFGLDALSSAAYGPEAALTLLISLGAAGIAYMVPITISIVILLLIVYSIYLIVRSIFRWILAGTFFFSVCPVLILLGIFVDPRKNDWPQRWLSRTSVRLAGARVEVRRSPGFNPDRVCFFVSNHVNLFYPFVLYSVTPQFIRGLELESHFRIPVYGWLMKRFGNVPVPAESRPSDLKRMWRLTQDAINRGVSLVTFPEGSRTITGRVGPFRDGIFRMAREFGTPITPVSIVGSFKFNRKTSWILRPSTIIVWLHDTIETDGYSKREIAALRDRVWSTVAGPVHASLNEGLIMEPETEAGANV